MKHYDLIIRNGTVADGTGGELFAADVAVCDGTIAFIGSCSGSGVEEIDASDCLVTPGFVDLHTHYDGQMTWSSDLSPSSNHGVTTVVAGNCGVGFAPCHEGDREALIDLMSGVEDIPEVVMAEGIPWNWITYPDFAKSLAARRYDVDVASLLPHAALRVFVMGARALAREAATETDIATMSQFAGEAIESGAIGFATSRMLQHRSAHGDSIPTARAAEPELHGIAMAMAKAGGGVFQIASDFSLYTDLEGEFEMFRRLVGQSGQPLFFSLNQKHHAPDDWKQLLALTDKANRDGLRIRAQVIGRPSGLLLGHELTKNPFSDLPGYRPLTPLPLADRVKALRDPTVRARLLGETEQLPENEAPHYRQFFRLGEFPDYEQAPASSVFELARAAGVSAASLTYDLLLEDEGHAILLDATQNYADGSLEVPLAMMRNPNSILGLGDGGAHMGLICDASWPTTMLAFWTRDRTRGDRLPIPWVVKAMTRDNAHAYGLRDRGEIAVGLKADINVIDYGRLQLRRPEVRYDLPARGRRIVQRADGYRATIVTGIVTRRDGAATGALPGRFVHARQRRSVERATH